MAQSGQYSSPNGSRSLQVSVFHVISSNLCLHVPNMVHVSSMIFLSLNSERRVSSGSMTWGSKPMSLVVLVTIMRFRFHHRGSLPSDEQLPSDFLSRWDPTMADHRHYYAAPEIFYTHNIKRLSPAALCLSVTATFGQQT